MDRNRDVKATYNRAAGHRSRNQHPFSTRLSARFFTIVMALFVWKTYILFAPLVTQVWGQYQRPVVELPLLGEATAEELTAGLDAGLYTSEELVRAYHVRTLETNSYLHAVTEFNYDAYTIARALDKERKEGKVRGPLHGLPILIKNNIATADRLDNTAGSFSLRGATVPRDATVVAKLRAAGAIILGKSNLSQWANFRSSNSSNGWSAHGGQVIGPYYPDQDPCGSSSGSGVAAAVGLAWATLGTETDGSIICPSQWNNIVGIKPTVGLTSRALVIPISEHQDTIGPMARTVKDAAYVLQAIAGRDPYDNYTAAIPFNSTYLPNYVAACSLNALKGARIGVPRQNVQGGPVILSSFNKALDILSQAGATIVDNITYTAWEEYIADNGESEGKVLSADFVANLAYYLSQLSRNPQSVTSLEDIRNFTQTFSVEQYPSRNTASFDASLRLNVSNTHAEIWSAYQRNLYFGGQGGLLGALDRYNLDAVVLPTAGASSISAIIGGPVITVPLGAYPGNTTVEYNRRGNLVDQAPGIPYGISFAGRLWSEEKLVGFAYAFEQRTNVRKAVKALYGPTTELVDVIEHRDDE